MSRFKTVVKSFTEELNSNNSEKEKRSFKIFLKPRIPGPSPVGFNCQKYGLCIFPLHLKT